VATPYPVDCTPGDGVQIIIETKIRVFGAGDSPVEHVDFVTAFSESFDEAVVRHQIEDIPSVDERVDH